MNSSDTKSVNFTPISPKYYNKQCNKISKRKGTPYKVCSPSDSVFSPVLTKLLGKTLKSKTLNTSKFSKVNKMLHELEGDKGKENVAKPVV